MIRFISSFIFVTTLFMSNASVVKAADSSTTAPKVADFKTKTYHGDAAQKNLWVIEISPPAGHHFNLEAPRSAQQEKFSFELVQESPDRILFQTDKQALKNGSMIEVSAFLCDEKKTYCMKKKIFVTLDETKALLLTQKFTHQTEVKVVGGTSAKKEVGNKEAVKEIDPFIDNDSAKAIAAAKSSDKPILIDFYGIWCPPCNLYNEIIFSSKEFAEQAKKYVLLKMDADDEKSWELKSKFKVGGYPTLIMAKENSSGVLEEIGRIVGYYPPNEFYNRLTQAYLHRNDSDEIRWKGRMGELLALRLEQKNYDQMISLTEKATDPNVLIYRWIAEMRKDPKFIKNEKSLAQVTSTFESLAMHASSVTGEAIISALELLNEEFWLKQEKFKKITDELFAELEKRVDPKTLFVKGTEITAPDLESMKMDIAETLKNDKLLVEVRKKTIKSYEKLIALYAAQGKHDLRSLNLEYAYLLWNDGRVADAKNIYNQFMQKYPMEFTFYYAASKLYLTIKDYKKAREVAEKAYQYSYGDNRIRSMERLVAIMGEQGLKKEAISRGKEFLTGLKTPQGMEIRTGKYIDLLKGSIAKLDQPSDGAKK